MPAKRSLIKIYLLGIITLGIYFIYWLVKTKNELNELGAKIPTAWLIIIPIANIYWLYKYAEGFAKVTKKESTVLWFLLFLLVGIVMPAIVQSELNKLAK
jgi:predicted transporter